MNKYTIKTLALIAIIAAISLYRLFAHPFNVTPVMAVALFAGTYFDNKWNAFLVPLVSMFLSDLILGFHNTMFFVYGAMLLSVLLGFVLSKKPSSVKIIAASITGSVLFFIITNFGVWLMNDFYPHNAAGLGQSYVMALPFFQRTLLGDLFFNGVLFVSFAYFQSRFLLRATPINVKTSILYK